jgi:hypothetical protein
MMAITKACRYEPGVNRTYEEMAAHYGVAGVPARPVKPRYGGDPPPRRMGAFVSANVSSR